MRRTIAGLALRAAIGLCLAAISTPRSLLAQGVAKEGPQGASSADSIDLAAQRMTTWSEGKVRWVQLEGQIAIQQGLVGPRGDRAIVRILPATLTGENATKLDAYIETDAVPGARFSKAKPASHARIHMESTYGVDLKPYKQPNQKENVKPLSGPPSDLRLLNLGFPRERDPGTQKTEPSQARRRTKPAAEDQARGQAPAETARVVDQTSMVKPEAPSTEPAVDPPRIGPGGAIEQPKTDAAVQKVQGDLGGELPQELLDSLQDPPAPGSVVPRPSRPTEDIPIEEEPPEPLDDVDSVPLPKPIGDPDFSDATPIGPGFRQVLNIYQIDSDGFSSRQLETVDGITKVVIRGGVNIVVETGVKPMEDPKNQAKREKERKQELEDAARLGLKPSDEPKQDPHLGTIDVVADNAVIWYKPEPPSQAAGAKKQTPMQMYVEGNVVFRQDDRKIAGQPDRRTFRAERAFYDFQTDRLIALDGEANVFSPGVISPMRISAPRIDQFPSDRLSSTGQPLKTIRADNTTTTGSRFADPGYKFTSRYMEANQIEVPATDPSTGKQLTDPDGRPVYRLKTVVDGRQNIFYLGGVPVFFWPYQEADEDDLSPSLREITPGYISYFGQYLLTDWNGFRVLSDLLPGLNIQKPSSVDIWNLEMDELSKRGVAFGTNIGYFGERLIPGYLDGYSGYFKIWGLEDHGIDTLGTGPAVITYGPPGLGQRGFQRGDVPLQQSLRGMTTFRHMQSFINNRTGKPSFADDLPAYRIIDQDTPTLLDLPNDPLEDLRLQLEFGLISDRHFQEEYYQNEWNTGRDQSTDLYLIRQLENRAATATVEGNLQNFYTQTQWLPRLDYYRLGDSFLGDRFTYFQHSGVDYAAVHTAIEVNNPSIFAFLPYDPVSNTSGLFQSGRMYTAHEIDMPINLKYLRIVPYCAGPIRGLEQPDRRGIDGADLGRVWSSGGRFGMAEVCRRGERFVQRPRNQPQDRLLRRLSQRLFEPEPEPNRRPRYN